MRQRLAFAAALLRAPRLLLLDEPSSALDPAGAREVRALIRALADAGTTVLLSSHNLVEVETLCSSATVLRDGTVVFSGDVDRLRALAGPEMHAIETSDDAAAIAIAEHHAAVRVDPAGVDRDAGFLIAGAPDAIDRYVVALGQAGIAVRRLRPRERSLETVFLHLTGPGAAS
jgi:ABC-2 type transport system ATP-binding protein